jgi:hypothetical protein
MVVGKIAPQALDPSLKHSFDATRSDGQNECRLWSLA